MGWSASIRVVDEDGDPCSGRKVTIDFGYWTGIDSEYTDNDGWAEFEYESIDKDSLSVKNIWIDSEEVDSDSSLDNGETRSYSI